MEYKIFVSQKAQKEIYKSIEYYNQKSSYAPNLFINEIHKIYDLLSVNPFYNIRYKNIRSIPIKKFPFSFYFTIDENKKAVKIISCFHEKQNPRKRPNLGN